MHVSFANYGKQQYEDGPNIKPYTHPAVELILATHHHEVLDGQPLHWWRKNGPIRGRSNGKRSGKVSERSKSSKYDTRSRTIQSKRSNNKGADSKIDWRPTIS